MLRKRGSVEDSIAVGSKIYISGPISGLDEGKVKTNFDDAEEFLTSVGMIPVNPNNIPDGPDWNYFMRESIKLLMDVEAIFMLDGWNNSKGSQIERYLAKHLDMIVMYE
jgi:hypothetical protein